MQLKVRTDVELPATQLYDDDGDEDVERLVVTLEDSDTSCEVANNAVAVFSVTDNLKANPNATEAEQRRRQTPPALATNATAPAAAPPPLPARRRRALSPGTGSTGGAQSGGVGGGAGRAEESARSRATKERG